MSPSKQLPMLRSLNVQTCETEPHPEHTTIIPTLCSSPTPTKLETLAIGWDITAADVSTLVQLPSLTELSSRIDDAAAPQLHLLTQLKSLEFWSSSNPFLPAIPQLHQLTTLTLYDCSLSDEQGGLIMAGCKQLSSLGLNIVHLQSLNWLVTPDSCINLLSFGMYGCDGIDASHMNAILVLKSLQRLSLDSTCRLDESAVHALTPPSTLLPNLTTFEYEDPEGEPQAEG